MSRTTRRKRPQFHGTARGRVRDGSPQHYSGGCERNGSCKSCSDNRTFASRRRAPLEL